ncbi:MAG TPA: metallophosphoesterase [Gemmataceae bacterium]|nr:metallophosphoesterase [Gemmataceae bacterium]
MTVPLRLALTADLHWGIRPAGDEATRLLIDFLKKEQPDALILAGDIGAGEDFAPCLSLFADLRCPKALVPGNHDIWVETQDPLVDSLHVYREVLPQACAEHGFHYLDRGPLVLPGGAVAVVGSINWYDYSWSIDVLRGQLPDWEEHLRNKRFTRGRHNDARFVRWPLDDRQFTAAVVSTLETHLQQALAQVGQVCVVTHHPAFYGLAFPRPAEPVSIDGLLWDAFAGNRALEAVLARHAAQIPYVFSGHTHRARKNHLGPIRGFNIGGDYHFKRLLLLDWPAGDVTAHVFGDPNG